MRKTKNDFLRAALSVYATVIANQAKAEFEELLINFRAKRISSREATLVFDAGMKTMIELCGDQRLGAAGKACIEERAQGEGSYYAAYHDKLTAGDKPNISPPVR